MNGQCPSVNYLGVGYKTGVLGKFGLWLESFEGFHWFCYLDYY
jgi:hypothetical protein